MMVDGHDDHDDHDDDLDEEEEEEDGDDDDGHHHHHDIIIMIWMSEGASRAQASRAIPCTSEPKSRAHMGCFPKTQKHHKSTFLHLEPKESWR